MSDDLRYEVERELTRVVDRLTTMPLTRAETARADVRRCARTLVDEGRALGVPIPGDAAIPDLGPQGLGSLIAVLGRDCLDATDSAGDATDEGLARVLDALVTLRRELP